MPRKKTYFTGEWYPWYWQAMKDSPRVKKLSLTEEGAYRRALDIQWNYGWLPSDPKELAEAIGKRCTVGIAKKILEFFVQKKGSPGKIVNRTLEEIRREQEEIFLRYSKAGKIGAAKRWGQRGLFDSDANDDANAIALTKNSKREEKREKRDLKEKRLIEKSETTTETVDGSPQGTPDAADAAPGSHSKNVSDGTNFFLKTLAQDPEYMHVNVYAEFDKASAWAQKKNKIVTPEFFQSWLDRIFKPIEGMNNGLEPIEQVRARVAQRDAALSGPDETDS